MDTTFPFSLCCAFIKKQKGASQNGAARPDFIHRLESRIESSFHTVEAKVQQAAANYVHEQEERIKAKINHYVDEFHTVEHLVEKVYGEAVELEKEIEEDVDAEQMEVKKIKTEVKHIVETLKEIPVRPSSSNSSN